MIVIKRFVWICALIAVVYTANAQTHFFTDKGFENVRIYRDSADCIISLENNARYPHWKGAQIATGIADSLYIGDHLNYKIIFLKRDIPIVLLDRSDGKWRGSYGVGEYWNKVKGVEGVNKSAFKIDITFEPDLWYRSVSYDQMYDVIVNILPTVNIAMGKGWNFNAQLIVPLFNDGYSERYSNVRPNIITAGKLFRFGKKHYLSATAGLFTEERYGVDVRYFYPINNHFSIDCRLGVTGYCSMAWGWECSTMKRVSGFAGVQYYNKATNIQAGIKGGRFIYGDYGGQVDIVRHFKYVAIGLIAQYSDAMKLNGGFSITIALPPYRQKRRHRVSVMPSNYFYLTYNAGTEPFAGRYYRVDSNENPAGGGFNPLFMEWGINKGGKK